MVTRKRRYVSPHVILRLLEDHDTPRSFSLWDSKGIHHSVPLLCSSPWTRHTSVVAMLGRPLCICVCLGNFVYYESIKRELKIRPTYDGRFDERLKTKVKELTRLAYTGLLGGLEHLKIETRLIDEKFAIVMSECVI